MTRSSSSRGSIGYVVAIFPSPTETFVAREIEALRRRGFDVVVFALRRPAVAFDEFVSSRETLESCEYLRPDHVFAYLMANVSALVRHPLRYAVALGVFLREGVKTEPATFGRMLFHFTWGIAIAAAVRKRGIERLHCHFSAACNAALAANLFQGTPFSFSAHASGDVFVKPVLLARKVREACAVIAVCEYSRRYVDSVTGFAYSTKLHRVYNGIDVAEPGRIASESAGQETRSAHDNGYTHLVSVGTLAAPKGHATLIEACQVLSSADVRVQCTIIGEGPDRAMLERRIAESGLKGVVTLVGHRSLKDVYRAMHTADVFVLLSEIGGSGYRDGFPTVLLEAMAMGLPTVSTWVSGIPEIVQNEGTGFLVPERDVCAAAQAIRRLISDPALRRQFGVAGFDRVTRLFSLDGSADQFARIMSESVHSSRAPMREATGAHGRARDAAP